MHGALLSAPARSHLARPQQSVITERLAAFPKLTAQRLFDEISAAGYVDGDRRAGSGVVVNSPFSVPNNGRLPLGNYHVDLRTRMMTESPSKEELTSAFEAVRGIELPKIPKVVLALQREVAADAPDIGKVGRILETDMALAGLTLRSVNSPAYGLPRRIESIPQAATLLGLKTLHEVVLATALKRALGGATAFDKTVWRIAKSNAYGGTALALSIEGVSADSAYLNGLFCDVGALILAAKDESYPELYKRGFVSPVSAMLEEKQRYGTSHAVIGFLLGTHWELPGPVCSAIYQSHVDDCTAIEDPETRVLVAIQQVTCARVSQTFFPGSKPEGEMLRTLSSAYMELIVDGEAMMDMADATSRVVS
jgi:HD-like signal output (HDOD) protein